ncbi:MAG TPA: MDR family MFS transporter [Tepidiformaceae bacterium]|jgi:EmrB/QacA subfamily drug resistance transporter|nr:MDR family MFS transporter [Tepidiformaceae bacterium]
MIGRIQYKYLVAIVFIFGMFMDLMDSTVVNVAVPDLAREFHSNTSAVEWTITGYLLSLAVFIPAAGFLSDRFGTKRAFLTAILIFVVASALCGQARSLDQLIFFRFLQGMGGGMMTPVGTAMLSREFPGAERAKASAIISVPIILAPALGPVIGGYLVEYVSWRWIFYINLPIGITGFLFGLKYLEEHKESYATEGFDVLGLFLGGGAAAMVLYALSEAATAGWGDSRVIGFGLAGIATGALFTIVELRAHPPLIDLTLLKRPLFSLGNGMVMPAFAIFGGAAFVLTLFLQEFQGRSPFEAGLIQGPAAIGTAAVIPFASRLYTKMGPRRMLLMGFALSFVVLVPFGFVGATTPAWVIVVLLLLRSLPFSFAMVAAQTIIYGPLENSKQGPASSLYNTLRQVAGSFGVALLATILITRTHAHSIAGAAGPASTHAIQSAYQDTFFLTAAFMLIPLVLALFINDKKTNEALDGRHVGAGAAGKPVTVIAD